MIQKPAAFQDPRPMPVESDAAMRAARETVLLLRGEIEKAQRQKARTVGDFAQQLPPPAINDFGEQYLALDRRALPRAQFSQRNHPRAVFVTQRQQEQKVLSGLNPQGAQAQSERIADAAQYRDRLDWRHRATMHSTSTCAPRGKAATPTAARAGYGSRKYSAMTLLTSAK